MVDMTHPDIIDAELYGSHYETDANKIGECLYCEDDVYDDNGDVVSSADGLFCDIDCCHEYYGIERKW